MPLPVYSVRSLPRSGPVRPPVEGSPCISQYGSLQCGLVSPRGLLPVQRLPLPPQASACSRHTPGPRFPSLTLPPGVSRSMAPGKLPSCPRPPPPPLTSLDRAPPSVRAPGAAQLRGRCPLRAMGARACLGSGTRRAFERMRVSAGSGKRAKL